MRPLVLVVLLVAAAPALAQPTADTTAHAVPFASAANALELAVANASAEIALAGVTVALVSGPAWLRFAEPEAALTDVAPGDEAPAAFVFDVDPAAPVGLPAEAVFEVRAGGAVLGTKAVRLVVAAPAEIALLAPRPNPSHGASALAFELPAAGRVRLSVYDVLGREVARPVEGERAAGRHTAALDGSRLAAGVYVVRLVVDRGEGRAEARTVRLTVAH